jgi:hypothetical protein
VLLQRSVVYHVSCRPASGVGAPDSTAHAVSRTVHDLSLAVASGTAIQRCMCAQALQAGGVGCCFCYCYCCILRLGNPGRRQPGS